MLLLVFPVLVVHQLSLARYNFAKLLFFYLLYEFDVLNVGLNESITVDKFIEVQQVFRQLVFRSSTCMILKLGYLS